MNKLLTLLLVTLFLLGSASAFHKQQSKKAEQETVNSTNDDQLQKDLKFLAKKHDFEFQLLDKETIDLENESEASKEKVLDVKQLKQKFKNACLKDKDGNMAKDVSEMNQKEKLLAFIRGPCSPAMLIPGIMGTSLQIEIDCEVLQKENPEIFKSCGWTTCGTHVPLVNSKPASEYRLWVAGVSEPMSIFALGKADGKTAKCFGNLMQLIPNPKGDSDMSEYTSPTGLRVTLQGNTNGSRDDSQCGNTAVSNLFSTESLGFLSCSFKGYGDMQEVMNEMGYQAGITYQSLPYDFRKSVNEVETHKTIKRSLISLKKFTGKTSFIVTHSYGSLHTLYALSKYDQEFKDTHIQQWIPTGAPFSGAPEVMKGQINADDGFVSDMAHIAGEHFIVGLQFYSQRKVNERSNAAFDLYPKNTQELFQDTPWMQEILKRSEYEQQTIYQDKPWEGEVPFDFLPSTSEICKPGLNNDYKYCQTYLYDELKNPIVTIDGNDYYLKKKDLQDMIKKYVTFPDMIENMDKNWQPAFVDLTNPGVRVTNVYGAFGQVQVRYEYPEDPVPYTLAEKYYFPKTTQFSGGDLTVNTNSALKGPLKWLWEHEHAEGDESKKPVRLVELCSAYNQTVDPNTDTNFLGEKTFNKSGYNGLNCKCFSNYKPDECQHSCIISEPYYMQMVFNMFMSNQVSQYQHLLDDGDVLPYFDHYEITMQMAKCPNLFTNQENPMDIE